MTVWIYGPRMAKVPQVVTVKVKPQLYDAQVAVIAAFASGPGAARANCMESLTEILAVLDDRYEEAFGKTDGDVSDVKVAALKGGTVTVGAPAKGETDDEDSGLNIIDGALDLVSVKGKRLPLRDAINALRSGDCHILRVTQNVTTAAGFRSQLRTEHNDLQYEFASNPDGTSTTVVTMTGKAKRAS